MHRLGHLAAGLLLLALPASADRPIPAAKGIHVTVRTTGHGIPHIRAGDFRSVAFGLGWSQGLAAVCTLAEAFVTVDGERSRFFGPEGSYDQSYANGTVPNNLQSDLFYAKLNAQRTVERLLEHRPPLGPAGEARHLVEGFAAGYNAALAHHAERGGIRDPACRGAPWVRRITPLQVWRRAQQLALFASSGTAIDGIYAAAPPSGDARADEAARALQAHASTRAGDGRFDAVLGGLGSNAIALGRSATVHGGGMLLGNPHFPWYGPERFYQAQLTVPGRMDVAGVSFLGVPLILNGFTRGLAWAHTVSTARRFVIYELPVVPGDPTAYVLRGQVREMERTDVTVAVRNPDGSIGQRSHSFYDTEYGPVLTSIQGLPLFPWTTASVYVLFDANAGSLGRLVNHYLGVNRAQSVAELERLLHELQGIPWVNTLAADSEGNAYYADIGSMPNFDTDRYHACLTLVGTVTDSLARLAVMDGRRPECEPGDAPGAAAPGLLPPSRQPSLRRDDYVANSNDSYWLVNERQLLTGFSRLLGVERTARLFRTRFGIRSVEDRLAGLDGEPGNRFTLHQLMRLVLDNRNYAGELWRDDLVAFCRANPTVVGSRGPVEVADACDALADWDLHENLESRGALLFRRFSEHVWLDPDSGDPWADRFDPADPVDTPTRLDTTDPKVQRSFADAVSELRAAGIPFDAPVGEFAYVVRNGRRIPIHGGPGVGAYNVIVTPFDPERGYPDVEHGTSYLQAVRLGGRCPKAYTLQAYSQSPDPTSPHHADQTWKYSRKEWIRFPFCENEIAAHPALRITRIGVGPRGWWRAWERVR